MSNGVPRRRCRIGFTLIELLVVIAVIALLISILIPALGDARNAARTLKGSSNLRGIAQGIALYANGNKDLIVGSPDSSGFDASFGRFNGIAMQTWDWMGPLAYQNGKSGPGDGFFSEGRSREGEPLRAARFNWYREQLEEFICPANDFQALPWPNPDDRYFSTGRMISYNMSTQFTTSTRSRADGGTGVFTAQDRGNYRPYIYNVGSLFQKAAVFEGHRYASRGTRPDFDHDMGLRSGGGGWFGGAFGGVGAWWRESKELDRTVAPGEPGRRLHALSPGEFPDMRRFAFRHGTRTDPNKIAATQVLGHIGFFDGHVELMTDGDATNPDYWFPTGTKLTSSGSFWNYTLQTWPEKVGDLSESDPYIVP
ncbi:MAG: type II secretion system protein [Planctomycetota bacterium]